jgi:FkbM family methyltransferase
MIGRLSSDSVVVDCGTGPDAELSKAMIDLFGSRCYGLEPTRRHHSALRALSELTSGRFTHLDCGVAAQNGRLVFYESLENVSGSVLADHVNVRRDETLTYEIETVGIDGLFDLLGVAWIDLLKLDIEGAEYSALASAMPQSLARIGQMIVEFHDHCVSRYWPWHTRRLMRKLRTAGFSVYSRDGINCLFFRSSML